MVPQMVLGTASELWPLVQGVAQHPCCYRVAAIKFKNEA